MARIPPAALWVALLLVGTLAGCGDDGDPRAAWREVAVADMSPAQQARQRQAVDARDRAAQLLVRRLGEAIDAEGPGGALGVCREAAPAIMARVAEEKGVSLGRTSFRLRNPGNEVPAWAEPYVEARHHEPVWLAGPDGVLAGLLPIQTMMPCLTCHGPDADLPDEVKDALARDYPKDAATGFRLGDLRGWFWVEVP